MLMWQQKQAPAFVPPPVRLHRWPGWFRAKVRAKGAPMTRYPGWETEVALQEVSAGGWRDHGGLMRYNHNQYLCSEPYTLYRDQLWGLMGFCEKWACDYAIYAGSHHYPTRCLRIVVWPAAWNSFPGGILYPQAFK
jgi:hypothetical protein